MLSEKDKAFMRYWEKSREAESTPVSKIVRGLPMAFMFSFPIVLSIVAVRLFLPEWYTKVSKTSSGMFITITMAVFILSVFFAFFRMHYKWEINEQLYQEYRAKETQENGEQVP
jgi:hypothetical protein